MNFLMLFCNNGRWMFFAPLRTIEVGGKGVTAWGYVGPSFDDRSDAIVYGESQSWNYAVEIG